MLAQTSILAYRSMDRAKMNALQTEIYNLIKECNALSNRDIARILNREICTVTGRVNELQKMGLVRSWAKKKDPVTNHTVSIWEVCA
jgi:Mn-dependent DtxR family transcriptional regulator